MPLDLTETLGRLVATASVNPMGRPASGPQFLETRLTDHLESLFRGLGLQTQRQPVAPGRDNLIARLNGEVLPERGGPLVLFDAHQDTVPADHMTIEPWTPAVREGRLYGRGSCDTKGGMAAMLGAIARLAVERPRGMPTIVMACTVDEEYRLSGAAALASSWTSGGLVPRAPDVAVVAEPTNLDVIVAHKGIVRWQCHTHGRAAHSSKPEAGQSAIYRMARVVAALERYEQEILPSLGAHPLCGPHTLNVGTIRGGSSVNIVPDQCTIEIELRLPPGATPGAARQSVIDGLAERTTCAFHDPPYMQGPALSDRTNGPLSERLAAAVTSVAGDCRRRGVPFATDAAFFCDAGTPAVVFGPGSIEQAHTADEWLPLDQLEQAADILHRFVKCWTVP
jgi:acetylornithine deacetylase/succinyl-diaminopimelate desuccinylase-like protein